MCPRIVIRNSSTSNSSSSSSRGGDIAKGMGRPPFQVGRSPWGRGSLLPGLGALLSLRDPAFRPLGVLPRIQSLPGPRLQALQLLSSADCGVWASVHGSLSRMRRRLSCLLLPDAWLNERLNVLEAGDVFRAFTTTGHQASLLLHVSGHQASLLLHVRR